VFSPVVQLGCFPADATVQRYADGVFSTSQVSALSIGDSIQCYYPSNQTLGACTVYYLSDVDHMPVDYVEITASTPSGMRTAHATANHNIPMDGKVASVGQLVPGTNVTVLDNGAPTTGVVVRKSAAKRSGAYNFYLSGGGAPVVDGVVFFDFAAAVVDGYDAGLIATYMYALHAPLWQGLLRNTTDQPLGTPFSRVPAGVCSFDRALAQAFYATVTRRGGALPTAKAYAAFTARILDGTEFWPDTFLQETDWPACIF